MTIAGSQVVYRRSARAKRLSMRVDPRVGGIVVVMPRRISESAAQAFVAKHAGWVMTQLARLPKPSALAPGERIAVLGRHRLIEHAPERRTGVALEADRLIVSGAVEHLPRRVRDFLKALARRELVSRAHATAGRLGLKPLRVSIRDQATRWGSCSPAGALSFSWRLILTPEWVMDYVVAHEVAHMRELNHGPRFWALVGELSPHVTEARAWLIRHGGDLHRYG